MDKSMSPCDAVFEAACKVEDKTIELNIFRNVLKVMADMPEPDIMDFVETLAFIRKAGKE